MRSKAFSGCCLVLLVSALAAQTGRRNAPAPPERSRCDVSLPIRIELVPLNEPQLGEEARFEIETESSLDPDLIKSAWVECRGLKGGVPTARVIDRRELSRFAKRETLTASLRIRDASRHEIRARYVVRLVDGRTIAQTAVRWVDMGEPDPPEGMIGRITDPDGTGIRVYQGTTVR